CYSFYSAPRDPPHLHSFPTRRSSDLQAYAALKQQLADYEKFIRTEILPKARSDFRLPPEEYAFNLDQYGVDMPPAQLIQRAHSADRKSTRLNSSHVSISYAVFCLKKK